MSMQINATSRKGVVADVCPASALTDSDRDVMCALLTKYFEGIDRASFDEDLDEKDAVIVLRDQATGDIKGFSTQMWLSLEVGGEKQRIIYSGDTIVDRDAWGQTELSRVWLDYVWRRYQAEPDVPLFWFLVSCVSKTYRFLPTFCHEFYPVHDRPVPPRVKRLLDAVGKLRFPEEYDADRGIVRFRKAAPVREGVADVTVHRLTDPHVEFFVRANPGYVEGHGLACLAEFTPQNLKRAALRLLPQAAAGPTRPR